MIFRCIRGCLWVSVLAAAALPLWGQSPGGAVPDYETAFPASLAPHNFVRNFAVDQRDFWTTPFRWRVKDLNWLLPGIGLTAGLMTADSELSRRVSGTGTFSRNAGTISTAGLAAAVAGGGGLFVLGKWKGDQHDVESGILSGEAALNALAITEVLKVVSQRERPTEGTGQGRFWKGTSGNSSFPSNHAMLTWSIASVIAHEYPGPLTKIAAYGLAAGVSFARVEGKYHFPSDTLVGSAVGFEIGRQVYSRHHDPDLPGTSYGTFMKSDHESETANTRSKSSPYVPLNINWIYSAFDRLYALGAIPDAIWGMKPWTRAECARMLLEAQDYAEQRPESEVARLLPALNKEFAAELGEPAQSYASIDSIYARATGINGPPLNDGYHFAQTIRDDYGRPYEQGVNFIGGFTSSASSGAFGAYFSGEFQHAPSALGYSQAVVDAIQTADSKPLVVTASPIASVNQFELLDSYAMLNLRGWQFSFGKQSLWLSPTLDPFMFSNNAAPIDMLSLVKVSPTRLPSVLGLLGPYRLQFFVGKLAGQHFVNDQQGAILYSINTPLARQPMINGQKISFKPTDNLEFGVGKTGMWGGPDFPVTLGTFKNSLLSRGNAIGRLDDPGDRRSFFDITYRIPKLRKWLTFYDESFAEDELSPLGYPRKSAHNAGLYMPQLPKFHKMDLRVEGGYTATPTQTLIEPIHGGFFNWNTRYLDGYTNDGNIIGSTIGRQGKVYRGATTYWFKPDSFLQLSYYQLQSDSQFLQGGNLKDIQLHSEWNLNNRVTLSGYVQQEWWNFPLLANSTRTDLTASLQITYWPHWRIGGK